MQVPEGLEGAGDLLVDEAAWTVEFRDADGHLPGDPDVLRLPGDLIVEFEHPVGATRDGAFAGAAISVASANRGTTRIP